MPQGGTLGDARRSLFESFVDSLPNPVFVKDEQHRWVVMNKAACELLGHPREELLGKSDYDFFPREQADVFWAKDDAVFSTGQLNENEEWITDAAGRLHLIITRKTLHADESGRRFLLGVITDITERKRIEDELRRSRDDLDERVRERTQALEEADRHKSEFLDVLSHELRNPLAPILSGIFVLESLPPASPQAGRARAAIRRQAEHLTRIVDDLLDVTRIARGKVRLRRDVFDLVELVRRTCEDHGILFEGVDVAMRVAVPDGPVPVDADPTRIAQVVGNLLSNASKFTPPGGAVTVGLAVAGDRAEITVTDTGIGIYPEQLVRLFQPFAQEERGLARTRGGLGLGLALSKGLVELHGGDLAATSEGPGRGARFVVSLPLAQQRGELVAIAPARSGGGVPPARRVVVIEDNVDAARTLADVLEVLGYEVRVALDGTSGLALARALSPDVVVCDIGLPDVDGYQVARLVRSDAALRTVRLIALSGYAGPEDRERSRRAGFDAHLAKPARLDELTALLGEPGARAAGAPGASAGGAG
jgi:PAS domain S-box-containing protein